MLYFVMLYYNISTLAAYAYIALQGSLAHSEIFIYLATCLHSKTVMKTMATQSTDLWS